jgi:hypothetical protein
MNEQIKKVALKAGESGDCSPEFVAKFAKLLVEECSAVIDGMKFTNEGPSDDARYQRTLCSVALKEYFGITSKGPVSSRNIP